MEPVNLHAFYDGGHFLGNLQAVLLSNAKLNDWRYSVSVSEARRWIEEWRDVTVLPKTRKALLDILPALDELEKLLTLDREVTAVEYDPTIQAMRRFASVFEHELEDTRAYLITPIGAYSVLALLEHANTHLSSAAQKVINEKEKLDFDKAGECLSLNLYTASGFHSMRAVEAEARAYHRFVTGVDMQDVPLGQIINGDRTYKGSGLRPLHAAEGGQSESALGLIIALLSSINKMYRCPIMHPDMTLDAQEAKRVFDLAALAISQMIADGVARLLAQKGAAP